MRSSLVAGLVAVPLILGGCAVGGTAERGAAPPAPSAPSPPSSPSAPSSPSPSAVSPGQARVELRRAERALVRADTGRYRTSLGEDEVGGASAESEGRYRLSELAQASEVDLTSGAEELQVSSVVLHHQVWVRLDQGPRGVTQRCWTTVDEEDVGEVTGYDVPGGISGLPAAVSVLLTLTHPHAVGYTTLRADGDLLAVASTMFGSAPQLLDIEPTSRATVPIDVELADGVVTGWSARFAEVVAAARADGADVPDSALAFGRDPDAVVQVAFTDTGAPVDLHEPPAADVVDVPADDPDYADAAARCEDAGTTT